MACVGLLLTLVQLGYDYDKLTSSNRMPAEKLEIMLKPIGFFDQNPALDVPGLKDTKSTLAFNEAHDNETQGAPGGTRSCCS